MNVLAEPALNAGNIAAVLVGLLMQVPGTAGTFLEPEHLPSRGSPALFQLPGPRGRRADQLNALTSYDAIRTDDNPDQLVNMVGGRFSL